MAQHSAIADKIARKPATLFAMESMTFLTSALVDRGGCDIRLEAAMCTMWRSERACRMTDDTLQIRGRRG